MKENLTIVHLDDQEADLTAFKEACIQSRLHIQLSSFTHIPAAMAAIAKAPPDIIVLDIEMGKDNGLDIARELADSPSMIVFLTSHSSYALQAYSLFALHYIVKPVEAKDVEEVLNRYQRFKPAISANNGLQKEQLNQLAHKLENPAEPVRRIFIHHFDHLSIVNINEVFFLEAENSYTRFNVRDGRKILSSESLKTYDEMLSGHSDLIRVHRSYMVNKNYVKEIRHDKHLWFAQMANGSLVEVSRLKKDWVMAELAK